MGIHVFFISLIPNVAINFFSFKICHSNDVVLDNGINRHLFLSQQTWWAQVNALPCEPGGAALLDLYISAEAASAPVTSSSDVSVLMLSIILLVRNWLIHIAMLFSVFSFSKHMIHSLAYCKSSHICVPQICNSPSKLSCSAHAVHDYVDLYSTCKFESLSQKVRTFCWKNQLFHFS